MRETRETPSPASASSSGQAPFTQRISPRRNEIRMTPGLLVRCERTGKTVTIEFENAVLEIGEGTARGLAYCLEDPEG